jgi:hypothetical protein
MKINLSRILRTRITSDTFDARLPLGICTCAGVLLLVLSFRNFAEADLDESQLLLGVLASVCLSLLFIVAGLLTPVIMHQARLGARVVRRPGDSSAR